MSEQPKVSVHTKDGQRTVRAPLPSWPVYQEFEAEVVYSYRDGPQYVDKRVVFEDTYCAVCRAQIGPSLGEDEDGRQYEHWTICFDGPAGLVCEDCANELDPEPEEVSK